MKRFIIAAVALLVAGGGVATFFVVKHDDDVAHAKAVRKARAERIERAYQHNLSQWREDDAQWTRENDAYEGCASATADAFDAADEVNGVIGTGGSRDEFIEPIQDFATEISGATRQADGNFDCLSVLLKLSKAQDEWTDATSIWLKWIKGDDYSWVDDVDDLPMDKHFAAGSADVQDAQRALSDMQPDRRPVKPRRGETYATPVSI